MSVMLNRLKNALSGDDAPDNSANNRQPRGRSRGPSGGSGSRGEAKRSDGDCRLPYSRPHFLHLSVDEVAASADKTSRPIILPRDVTKVPWCAGYAEVINAGKSEVNEDQARAERIILKNCASRSSELIKLNNAESLNEVTFQDKLEIDGNFIVPDCLDRPEKESEAETVGPAVDADLSDKIKESKERESELSDVEKEVDDRGDKIKNEINVRNKSEVIEDEEDMSSRSEEEKYQVLMEDKQITMTFFGIFDGHAGYGAAVIAATTLHYIITDNLLSIIDLLISKKAKGSSQSAIESLNSNDVDLYGCCVCQCHRHKMNQKSKAPVDINDMGGPLPIVDKTNDISIEELVIGAIEKSFQEMDQTIDKARQRFNDSLGGCAALAAIFFMGKLFIANAGDCRAVICHNGKAVPVSFDFTPETERKRIYTLANLLPHLLHNEFRVREFVRRPTRKDIGKKLLCREAWMSGWSLNTVKSDDLKVPVITGEGKRARLLATIGVTRGFGDHGLHLYDSDIRIKPFLSSVPDVKVIDMNSYAYSENDVLIMASDGLWDTVSSDEAATIVQSSLSTVEISNPKRYTLAAQDLLMHARGIHRGQWRTTDDITVFLIPLCCYGNNSSKV